MGGEIRLLIAKHLCVCVCVLSFHTGPATPRTSPASSPLPSTPTFPFSALLWGMGAYVFPPTRLYHTHNPAATILSVKWRTQQSVILRSQLLIGPDPIHLTWSWQNYSPSEWSYISVTEVAVLPQHSSAPVQWWGSGRAVIKEGVKEARGLGDLLCFLSKRSWTLSCGPQKKAQK